MSKKKFYSIAFGLCFIVGVISQLIQDRPFEFAASLGAATSLMLLSIIMTFIIQLVNKLFKKEKKEEEDSKHQIFIIVSLIFELNLILILPNECNYTKHI